MNTTINTTTTETTIEPIIAFASEYFNTPITVGMFNELDPDLIRRISDEFYYTHTSRVRCIDPTQFDQLPSDCSRI